MQTWLAFKQSDSPGIQCIKSPVMSPLADSQKWFRLIPSAIGGAIDGVSCASVNPARGTTELISQARHSQYTPICLFIKLRLAKEYGRNG